MDVRVNGPGEDEKSNGDQRPTQNRYTTLCQISYISAFSPHRELTWGKPPFRLKVIRPGAGFAVVSFQALVIAAPDWIGKNRKNHAHEKTKKAQATLPQYQAIHIGEDELESSEKEVQDSQENGRENAQAQTHWLQCQQKNRPIHGPRDSLRHRPL